MLLDTTYLAGFALLLLRIIVAIIIFSSGKSHFQKPEERGKSIGMSPQNTKILGLVEILGAVSIALGLFPQIGALIIMGVMAGAIYKKVVVWKTSFYAEEGYGWHYDLFILAASFVIFATDGGYLTFI